MSSEMEKKLLIFLLLIVIMVYFAFNMHPYNNGYNKGTCVIVNTTCYGYEISGKPGFVAYPIDDSVK